MTKTGSDQDTDREDEGCDKEGVISDGVAHLLQGEFSFWSSHPEYLLDLIVGIVAFFRFVCHVSVANSHGIFIDLHCGRGLGKPVTPSFT